MTTDGWSSEVREPVEEEEEPGDPSSLGRVLLAALCRPPAELSPAREAQRGRDEDKASSIEDDADIPPSVNRGVLNLE